VVSAVPVMTRTAPRTIPITDSQRTHAFTAQICASYVGFYPCSHSGKPLSPVGNGGQLDQRQRSPRPRLRDRQAVDVLPTIAPIVLWPNSCCTTWTLEPALSAPPHTSSRLTHYSPGMSGRRPDRTVENLRRRRSDLDLDRGVRAAALAVGAGRHRRKREPAVLVRKDNRRDSGSNSVAWRGRSVMKEIAGRQRRIATAQGHRGWSRTAVAGNPRLS
jgi:hypothetical protein